jgi:hypothetical protein
MTATTGRAINFRSIVPSSLVGVAGIATTLAQLLAIVGRLMKKKGRSVKTGPEESTYQLLGHTTPESQSSRGEQHDNDRSRFRNCRSNKGLVFVDFQCLPNRDVVIPLESPSYIA